LSRQVRTVLHIVEAIVFIWFAVGLLVAFFNMLTGDHRDRQATRVSQQILDRGPRQVVDMTPPPEQKVEKVRRIERRGRRRRGG
jgi:hypothetical protein